MRFCLAKENAEWQVGILMMFAVVALLLPDTAFASTVGSPVGFGICWLAAVFSGEVAAGLGTIAICTIGVLACVGRVQWTTAIMVGCGIGAMFASGSLLSITSSSWVSCSYWR